jgi:DNA-binding GntR family transcriptional regulator
MISKLTRKTLKEQAYQALRDMIVSHRFSPGKWINVEQLVQELGVSRTPIRLALKQLEEEKLVRHIPNRGVSLMEMTLPMAKDLYHVRGVLEGMAARLAAMNMDSKTRSRMEAVLRAQLAIIKTKDLLQYSASDFDFHSLIYDSCGNWLLKELLDNIKNRSRPLIVDLAPILPDLYEDHKNVWEALKNHDGTAAEKVMIQHNLRMYRHIERTNKMEERALVPKNKVRSSEKRA